MKVNKNHVAIGTAVISIFCLGYLFYKKRKIEEEEVEIKEAPVEMETKLTIEIPMPTGTMYSEEDVTAVFKLSARYFGESRFLAISGALSTIIASIEDTCKDRVGNVDEVLVGEFMSPIIFMLDNKVRKKQHDVAIDVQAFRDEILPKIIARRPGFDLSLNTFIDLIMWNKPTVVPPRQEFEGFNQPQQLLH